MRVLLSFLAINIAGCAIQAPLTPETAANLKGRMLTTTARRRAAFLPRAPNPFLPALSDAIGRADQGDQIIRQNGILDPALAISRQLSDDLEHRYGLRRAPRSIAFDEDDPTKLSLVDPSADLVIDVWTSDWSLNADFDEPSKSRLRYAANFRLIDAKAHHVIDAKTGLVIAEGTCSRLPDTPASAATREQFLAGGARRLKDELELAVQFCVEEFRSKVLHPK